MRKQTPKTISNDTPAPGHNASSLAHVQSSQLTFHSREPRRYSKRDLELTMKVLDRLPAGAPLPIVINDNNVVLVGQLLVKAAQAAKMTHLLVVVCNSLSDVEQKHFSLAINQLLSKGTWDPSDLEHFLREFESSIEDFDHLALGFDNGELDRALGLSAVCADTDGTADAVPALTATAVSKLGSLWQLDRHRLFVGDARAAAAWDRLMDGNKGRHAITDPPFGCKVEGFVSRKGLHREFVMGSGASQADMLVLFREFCGHLAAALAPGALAHLFIDWRSQYTLMTACNEFFDGPVQLCCWIKDRLGMGSLYRSQHELVLVYRARGGKHHNNVKLGGNGRNRSNAWHYPSAASSRTGREGDMLKQHPTPKTVEMIADAILDCTEHGDIVIDCFLGSGTTLIAAERTGRACFSMELDPHYADVAIRRWQKWTGGQAIDAETGKTFDQTAVDAVEANDE